ncbi:uncharacterized protein B0P05DRAFT_577596 [Gilbertella persicaria]|uniref:uncharacterized protein n=1 Tax=Gilbertella persicaria TaxID=101096 RepID=UPI00221F22FB|nr:uncharacterized protein B0P05DRAFT_577596 [Gilbertella persicaria]KAI8091114.1 hypothetical protein B0P05DRAFT_577596 [Gilbertella persicaria]
MNAASQLSPDTCLNYQRHDSIDYSRRPSYFTGLLGNPSSEVSSYADHQETPSPFNGYEEYPVHHPLDTKRRLSTLVELNQYNPYCPQVDPYAVVNPWIAAAAAMAVTSPTGSESSRISSSPMMYAHPAVDMYSPQNYFQQPMEQGFQPMLDTMDGMFRERASSASSASSGDSALSVSPPASRRTSKIKSPLKPSRSRGRRVSNSPSIAGQKVFTCKHDDCGKVFKRSEHLKRHVRSIHTLEKPFECPYQSCSKRFSRSDNLNQHIRIHRHTGKDKNNQSSTGKHTSMSNYMPMY